jgi:hypothetical protein
MKTAMQELLDELKEYQLEFNIPIEVIDMCESQLNVEKEQIINAHLEGWSDAYDYLKSDSNDQARQAEDYYNETYNQ